MIKYKYVHFIWILLFSLFISFFPWEKFRAYEYTDRLNNYNYITYYTNKIEWFEYNSAISYISYEWLWHFLLNFLSNNLGFSAFFIFFIISFLNAISFSKILYKNLGIGAIFLLINPNFIDFNQSQLRLAFASSILGFSYLLFLKNKKILAFILLLFTPFIHTSSLIFLLFAFLSFLVNNYFSNNNMKFLILSIIGFFSGFVMGPLRTIILGFFEDRRAEFSDMSSPFITISFWVITYLTLGILILLNKIKLNFEICFSLIILSLIFSNIFFPIYSSRFISATFPFLLISLFSLPKEFRLIGLVGYSLYSLFLWVFWIY